MNSETFAQFLKTPAYLYRISYQELKSLVVQYPYCQNLRYLLLKKSQTDQHLEYERNLQMAATYSVNRSFLYEQLYNNETTPANRESNVVLPEEALELKDLETLETLDLEPQKEVLLAKTEDLSLTKDANSSPTLPPLEFSEPEIIEGDISSDALPDDTDAAIEELFEEVLEDELLDEEPIILSELNKTEDEEAHQISEVFETVREEDETAPVNQEIVSDNLDIVEEIDEEDLSDVLPESSSDDIDDLFAEEEPGIVEILPDTTSIGLDVELPEAEEMLNPSEEPASDFVENMTTGIGTVSLAAISSDDAVEESDAAPTVDLEVKKKVVSEEVIDIMDLSPVKQDNSIDDTEELEIETELISPQSSFSSWLKQFNSPQISIEIEDLDEKNEKKKKKVNYKYELVNGEWKQIKTKVRKKKKKSKAELIAAESVKLSKDVVTETLAQLLEKQEHYAKAIKMYERLRLENPEKSDYFASKIETLQLKL